MQETVQEAAERIFSLIVVETPAALDTVREHIRMWLDQRPCLDERSCRFRRTVLVELMECSEKQGLNPVDVGEALGRLLEARLDESVAA